MACPHPIPHILIADDYPDAAEILAELLRGALPDSCSVDLAFDGRRALALAIARPPRFALLDIDMPFMDGIEAAFAMRAALGAACPRLIGLTGNLGHLVSMPAHLAFDEVLAKPVDLPRLMAMLTAK